MKKKAFIVGVVLSVLLLAFLLWPKQRSVAPNADLKRPRSVIASNENGFYLIANSPDAFELSEKERNRISEARKSGDTNKYAEVLVENAQGIEVFEKVLSFKHFQIEESLVLVSEYTYLSNWKALGFLNDLRARLAFAMGDEEEAFRLANQIIVFGTRIKQGLGPQIHYHVGRSIQSVGNESLEQFAVHSKNSKALEKQLSKLKLQLADYDSVEDVLKAEYESTMDYLNRLAEGTVPGTLPTAATKLAWKVGGKFLINTEKSEKLLGSIIRKQIRNVPLPWNQMDTNPPSELELKGLKTVLTGNAVGTMMIKYPSTMGPEYLRRKCEDVTRQRATLLRVALRCYVLKYGVLPDSLEQLVPEFLTAVPLDDFDGKPLRYSKEQKLVYSVGEDLVDSGGIERDSNRKRLDIVYSFDPAKLVFKQKKEGMNSPPEQIELVE